MSRRLRARVRATTAAAAIALLPPAPPLPAATLAERDARLVREAVAAMPAQRPGHPDLYVVGFAGDGHEDVFRNEVEYLRTLADARLDAGGRTLLLVNHADSLGASPRPLATLASLRDALARIGAAMDREQDVLLLFMTTHGTEDHELVLQLSPLLEARITPEQLRDALADSGIRNRVVVVSACYSGGFLPALRAADALVLTAARHDRPSFGCGTASVATWFGRAWLVEGLNAGTSFIGAYDHTTVRVRAWERDEGFAPSLPQVAVGERIGAALRAWQHALPPAAPAVPYPHPLPED